MPVDSAASAALARSLMRETRTAALATLDASGGPFTSFVTMAPADDGSPLMLLSRLAVHTRNLQRDRRASLLLVRKSSPGSESMATARLTLTGHALRDDDPASGRVFLACHPDAALYSNFADFCVYRFTIAAGHLVAGFGQIVSLVPDELTDVRPGK